MAINIVSGPLAGVSPSGMSGLVLWLEASDNSNITLDGMGNVSQWNDISPSGHNFTGVLGARPAYVSGVINGLNALQFESVDTDTLTAVDGAFVTRPLTMFLVASGNGVQFSIVNSTSNTDYIYINSPVSANNSTIQIRRGGNLVFRSNPVIGGTNGPHIVAGWTDGTNGGNQLNGSIPDGKQTGTSPTATIFPVTPVSLNITSVMGVPRSSPFGYGDGYIAEIIVFDRIVSKQVRFNIIHYLADKWGINLL